MSDLPKLTDDAVAGLPLPLGRAELLEEIMSTPVVDHTPVPSGRHQPADHGRAARWLVPAAAAAVVAGLATVPLWWGSDSSPSPSSPGFAASTEAAAEPIPAGTYRTVLDTPGWTTTYVEEDRRYGGEVTYSDGAADLTVRWSPASTYDDYVEDREHIVEPPAPGEPVEVLGAAGQLWAYSADDHTVIREVVDEHWLEIRGSGMSKAAFLDLLGDLRLVDRPTFEVSLPDEFVTTDERAAEVEKMIDGIAAELAPLDLTPMRTPAAAFDSDESDRYQLGADVARVVACAWLDDFSAATAAGDQARADAAAQALATSHRWPILLEMDADGDYPEVLWEYADETGSGQVPEGYQAGLGCQ